MKKLFFFLLLLAGFYSNAQTLKAGVNKTNVDIVAGSGVFKEPAIIWIDSAYFNSVNSTRRYALLISGHGTGEAGSDTISLLNSGVLYNLNHGDRPWGLAANGIDTVRFIVVGVQRSSYGVDPAWYSGIFEDLTSRLRIDSSRIYAYGMSSGEWMACGIPVNNTDTTYTRFLTAIWTSSGADQDLIVANKHIIADRNIPLMMDVGDQVSDAAYVDAAVRMQTVLVPLYSRSDTILQRGYGHDHFPDRVLVSKTYAKIGNRNIYQWFTQFTNPYAGQAPPNPLACNTAAKKKVTFTTTATNEIYLPNGTGQLANIHGGDTILIPVLAGGAVYSDIILQNFHGDSCNHIIIQNTGGQVLANFMRFEHADYFDIIGNGTPGVTYGFKLGAVGQSNALGIGICSHFRVKRVDAGNGADVGFLFKKNPDPADSLSIYPNYVMRGIHIDSNWIHITHGEGMYIGHTYPYSDPYSGGLIPIRLDSVEIDHNIVQHTDWDGIQLSNALNGAKIHDNTVYDYGKIDAGSQRAGIILGANTSGDVYNNSVILGTGNDIQIFGYGKINVYNNVLDSGGRTQDINGPGSTKIGEQDFFSNDDSNQVEGVRPLLRLNIHDNVIHHQQVNALIYTIVDQHQSDSLYWNNNTVCLTSDTTNWKVKYFNIGQPKTIITHLALLTNCGSVSPPPSGPPPYVRVYSRYAIRRFRKKS